MIKSLREKYNAEFKQEEYEAFLKDIDSYFDRKVDFKIAETPIFLPDELALNHSTFFQIQK